MTASWLMTGLRVYSPAIVYLCDQYVKNEQYETMQEARKVAANDLKNIKTPDDLESNGYKKQ